MMQGTSKEFICRHIWNLLTTLASKKETCSYTVVRDHVAAQCNVKYATRAIGGLLEPIQQYCMDSKLPPLTALVVSKDKGVPGSGFIAAGIRSKADLPQVHNRIFEYNWAVESNPFQGFDSALDSVDSYSDVILKNPSSATEVYSKVKVRGPAQQIFRRNLIKVYGGRCAVCGFAFVGSLQAAHIKPWALASDSERIAISNGILLCPTHHELFDSKERWLDITADYKVSCNVAAERVDDGGCLKPFVGRTILLPRNSKYHPSKDLLQERIDGKYKD